MEQPGWAMRYPRERGAKRLAGDVELERLAGVRADAQKGVA